MDPINHLIHNGCFEGQGFGQNLNPLYASSGNAGHPGIDVNCGYGSGINPLVKGLVYSTYPVEHPASDGYTAVFTICDTPLETFEFSYGHVSEIDCQIGQEVATSDVIAKEGNKGPVYVGNRLITLAEQAAGNHEGSHRHYQKRPVFRTRRLNGHALQTATGVYIDSDGYYYQVYAYNNGFNGCVDWTKPLFTRTLTVGSTGYDVYLLQKALKLEGFASFDATGNFGPLTMAALLKYQTHYGLTPFPAVGPGTRAALNSTYHQLA